eukprot:Blabericola_migrator_1__427@NODE_1102_length_5429_cov_104_416076_g755_i0_p1_GENE_NODE_1102_length_5429_cov_104_416076_g755_i0NODE_1102_length_5429_cov_104_416076_g755_i0_p1_ORF_typecomplete_len524_score118_61DEAD/PF00270_29/9_4e50DEAD/PF00270_29/13Helicase_C/PF00271_31/3_6e03Helicase_C/PF00271_31/1_4e03Helicase_C/PF00271_31/4_9e28ERCC3_RAD25_C/PF16203_5/1_6e12ResIII/PF04851_15/6_2e11SNF2_N/PF00176_23/0_00012SecA_DEAD/PF07517_14/0_00031AAA_19/PF13245_6/0_00065Flavi_DEAD/PF07652_14/0_0011UTP25/PF0
MGGSNLKRKLERPLKNGNGGKRQKLSQREKVKNRHESVFKEIIKDSAVGAQHSPLEEIQEKPKIDTIVDDKPVNLPQATQDEDVSTEPEYVTSGSSSDSEVEASHTPHTPTNSPQSFVDLGLADELMKGCTLMGWEAPTEVQKAVIPIAMTGRDIIALAETGSGKTGAFVLPILHKMLTQGAHPMYALVMAPSRELATQIAAQFAAFGKGLLLKVLTLIGGMSEVEQAKSLARDPHVLVSTPGRLLYHLTNTRGFSLAALEFFVLDEADKLLIADFETELRAILKQCPSTRQTLLFSATMTTRITKLEKLSLQNPIKVGINEKTDTAANLIQYMKLVPFDDKLAYTAALLKQLEAYRSIVFSNTCRQAAVLAAYLNGLNIQAVAMTGNMTQGVRLNRLNRFKKKEMRVLVTTEVGSRGLDLPEVHYVINFDVPQTYKDYIHRVGRTARAGKKGQSITLCSQYDCTRLTQIEQKIGVRCMEYNEVSLEQYKQYDLPALKKSAELQYEEALQKKIFVKKRKRPSS